MPGGLLRAIADKVIIGPFSYHVVEAYGAEPSLIITGYTAFHPL